MRFRIFVSAVAIVAVAAAATITLRGSVLASAKVCCAESHDCCEGGAKACCKAADKQWSVVNFVNTVLVKDTLVAGPVLIVHDDKKMANGEPCTTFYRFDPSDGPKEALVSFHCTPRRAAKVEQTTFITSGSDTVKRLTEYQIAGDAEAHGVPR